MEEKFASGHWQVQKGKEEEFIQRWTDFLKWTRETQSSLVGANLIQDEQDPSHFLSFAQWEDEGGRVAWREDPMFGEKLSACRALCEDFRGGDYERVVAI
jgi:heme-degrading monooxygenase HmoA